MRLNLRAIRHERGWTIDHLAELSGLSRGYVSQLETGKRQPGPETITTLCGVLGVAASDLIEAPDECAPPTIAVPGRAGAGAEVFLVDDYAKGAGLYHVECPPQLTPRGIVAVEVKGDSMEPVYSEGDLLFYSRVTTDGVPVESIGRKVIAQTADGRVWVKAIKTGTVPGMFHLLSLNQTGPNMLDVPVRWAAPVLFHLPREFVRQVEA